MDGRGDTIVDLRVHLGFCLVKHSQFPLSLGIAPGREMTRSSARGGNPTGELNTSLSHDQSFANPLPNPLPLHYPPFAFPLPLTLPFLYLHYAPPIGARWYH